MLHHMHMDTEYIGYGDHVIEKKKKLHIELFVNLLYLHNYAAAVLCVYITLHIQCILYYK